MPPPNIIDPSIAGDARDNLDAYAAKVFADHPNLASQIEIAENVDADGTDAIGWRSTHELKKSFAGRFIAVFFRSLKSFGMHRQNRNSLLPADALANSLHIVADDAHNAGGIDECGLGLMRVDQLAQGRVKLLLSSLNYVKLTQFGLDLSGEQCLANVERLVRRAA